MVENVSKIINQAMIHLSGAPGDQKVENKNMKILDLKNRGIQANPLCPKRPRPSAVSVRRDFTWKTAAMTLVIV